MTRPSPLALLPMVLFLSLFIGSGLFYQAQGIEFAFYEISAPVAILPAIVLAGLTGLLLVDDYHIAQWAKDIAGRYQVDPRRSASLMDITSCVVQGIIPWGAQMLLAASIAELSPLQLMDSVIYCWVLAVALIMSIAIGRPLATPK